MALDATLGVFEIGILIAGVLFGVVTAQVYIHHKTFPEENPWIKFGLVDSMWLIELGHTMCVFHVVYFYTVTHYGDPSSLQVLPASIGAAVVLHGLTIMIVQGYFTYRIWRFTEKLYIPVFSCFLMFCQLLAVMTLASQLITIATKSLAKFMAKWEWLMFTVLVLRAIADITVSGSLVFHLLNGRRGALKSTVAVVDKLILWTIETGILTSILGFLSIIFYLALKTTYLWLGLLMLLPKVFSNTMLANMNSRATLRNMHSSVEVTGRSTSSNHHGIALQVASQRPVNISVHTEVDTQQDSESRQWPLHASVLEMDSETRKSSYAVY
ncbi:hypothetical protein DFH05DRAFT_401971 [Lentinula detonsa]|uniref:DUF6534 domain-containing protein n=1 Tax=Lentinula detonsa TaxID=2804962 RepID=A0A9W8NTJ0_9AGAR|nr:hypothetical protein DFH05DRAFT_401971 [Lentinula detonsa]